MSKLSRGHYYYELHGGICSVRKFANIRQAKVEILKEQGTDNVRLVRPATVEDVDWHQAMGGHIF